MYPNILGTAGAALAISSIVSLILLVKKYFKFARSSHYIFATSDIFSSFLTAILLFFNQYNSIEPDHFSQDSRNLEFQKLVKNFSQLNGTSTTNQVYPESTDCSLKTILMQYAMFLLPFTNAFISLVSMSIQCNMDVESIRKKCGQAIEFEKRTESNNKISIFNHMNRRKKTLASLSAASSWVIPFLLTWILNFADKEKINILIRSNEMTCAFTTNFPFENCYDFENDHEKIMPNENKYVSTLVNNYIAELSPDKKTQVTNADTNQVVTKIYEVVASILNATNTTKDEPQSFYDIEQLTNFADLMNPKPTQSDQEEPQLFDELMMNSTLELPVPIYSTTNTIGTTDSTTEISNINKNNQQIFTDIVERIHSVSTKFKVRDKNKYQQPQIKSRRYSYNSLEDIENDETNRVPKCMEKQCFISTKFLRLHLFLLLILIYFLPILLSLILNMRAKYICSTIIEKVDIIDAVGNKNESISTKINKPSKFSWFEGKKPDDENISLHHGKLDDETCVTEAENLQQIFQTVRQEINGINKLSDIFRLSLILAIVLWTPMVLELLMKVYLCSDPPTWLTNFLYLTALSFGIARNIMNLLIIKIQEKMLEICKRKNSIHPMSSGSSTSRS